MLRLGLAVAAFAALVITSGAAQAQSGFGSGAFSTARPCLEPVGQDCFTDNKPPVSLTDGGSQRLGATAFDLGNGSSSIMQTGFGDLGLPELRGAITTAADQRVGATGAMFRSFTYEGDQPLALALSGDVNFTSSGAPTSDESFGQGQLYAFIVVFRDQPLADFSSHMTADDVFNCVVGATNCWPFLNFGDAVSVGAPAGQASLHVGVDPVLLQPGESFVVATFLQMIGNRGGFVDASDGFQVTADTSRSYLAGSGDPVSADFLRRTLAASAIPEPTSWLLLVLGLGAVGSQIRGRRRRSGAIAPGEYLHAIGIPAR